MQRKRNQGPGIKVEKIGTTTPKRREIAMGVEDGIPEYLSSDLLTPCGHEMRKVEVDVTRCELGETHYRCPECGHKWIQE